MTRAVVFAYHNVGVRCLSVLLAHGVEVALVVTHHDNPLETIWFDSVAKLAALHGIETIMPDDPNDPAIVAKISALDPDYLFSFYYRQMLKPMLLSLPKRGAWNMHGSLLPKYRGRVPVNWAVLHGEHQTGATLHRMLEKPDAGGILVQQSVPILPDDTAHEVFQKVTVAAELALDSIMPQLLAGTAQEKTQNLTLGSYFGGRKPADGCIDWNQSAAAIHNLIRAVAPPYPGAFCVTPIGHLRILKSFLPAGKSPHSPEPGIYEDNGKVYADCGDAKVLQLLTLELNDVLLDAETFKARFGTQKILLT